MNANWVQDDFASALIDRTRPVPVGTTSWTATLPLKRFNVYRGNVAGSLCEALAVRYPAVQRLVGDEFFQFMAREYALRNLPASPVLIYYGAEFPAFISAFGPAKSVPYLADVANLESAHWEAYHASDAKPVDVQAFSALGAETLDSVRFELLPSVRVVSSRFPIVSIWKMNVSEIEVTPVDLDISEDALIARPELHVDVRILPAGAALFLSQLKSGVCLGEAAGAALEANPDFDLPVNLSGLIQARLVARIFK